jgi:acid phosphatase
VKIRTIFFIALLTIASGCINERPPINLSVAKEKVESYYQSGRYEKDLEKLASRAIKYFEKVPTTTNATIIFDIDETLLSSYEDQKKISFGYVPKLSHEWVQRADAPVIPEIKKIYDYLVERGFTIVLMTGRKYDEYDATIKNLHHRGIKTFDKLIVRQKDEIKLSAKDYKTKHRKILSEQGYKIVGCIGDQWSDLEGGYSGHSVKVPNYTYVIR